jgi:16S rRNA (uracil1498-N3)-methyltransferase
VDVHTGAAGLVAPRYSRSVARFYAPGLEPANETVALDDDEASHLVRVLRLAPGAEVRVFNGRGVERLARVELADRRGVVLRVLSAVAAAPELPFPLTLAQSALKGDGMDEVARDAVMLGVTRIQPLVTERSEMSRAQIERGHRIERWARIAVSSAKQCGRSVVPPVDAVRTLDEALSGAAGAVLVLVEPGASASAVRVRELPGGPPAGGATVIVGPEGGWSPAEIARALERRATLVTLGALTLRADAAARVALPVLRYAWGTL